MRSCSAIIFLFASLLSKQVTHAQVAYSRSHVNDADYVQEHLVLGKDMPHDFHEEDVPDVYADSVEEQGGYAGSTKKLPKPTKKVMGPDGKLEDLVVPSADHLNSKDYTRYMKRLQEHANEL
mmetsp:Transcript_24768/g.38291  ORF Transcript_24768/g.38291 Transcript_24768/m.38291 type:complete len:122 (+) Transcript_24768:158-523(+)|eukprot:CAMPEP_0196809144 /NCGR_PEP_ID=MMETSP1362-20130617/9110_1 /TAXON_ID=163516 /ORGANISM="Leptocylindrus danicus, Strain CCMP1856" /LENGTH=121 /DNA_ID=CAMNT_0042183731 /DNA_START=80 /DNA_END=445 /DNA_ORIENTATION=-